jgi:cell surface protein SprA
LKHFIRYSFGVGIVFSVLGAAWGVGKPESDMISPAPVVAPVDSDTTQLRYPIHDRHADKYNEPSGTSPLLMGDPSNITDSVEYDPSENQYNISEHIGNQFYRNPSYLTFEEFREHEFDKSTKEYWKQRAGEEDELHKKSFAPKLVINSVIFDRIFGGNTIDIRPQGSAELTFALKNQKNQNPALPERQRSVTTFDFNENIQMNVTANIGDKMKLGVNYNTQATFDFENKMKLEYTGYEDDIIKKIEAGNVTLPLNSQLIQGSQSLFGIKTQLQFGRMMVTAVFSQQKGKSQTIEVKGGAQTTKFEIKGDQYEANRHFFLSQYFRDQYETALKDVNQIRSGVNITRIEVWVRNTTSTRPGDPTRNLIAIAELGETTNLPPSIHPVSQYPDNAANDLYTTLGSNVSLMRANPSSAGNQLFPLGLQNSRDYVVQENARLLSPSEYSVNELLGYISLNSELASNQVLAVAYEYTLNGQVYHVGELSTSGVTGSQAIFVKLLRSTTIDPSFFTWDLMMKNIYNLGGYQLKQEQFRFDVLYQDDRLGGFVNYIPDGCSNIKGIPLIKVLGLDRLNANGDPQPDGVFDWKEGVTINAANGRIIFPVLEPFGSSLRSKFCLPGDNAIADKYIYQALYDTTRVIAQQQAERNKFSMRGSYQSSSGSDIPLNAVNVPPGSVKVTAGGQQLKEGSDYTVDYTLGRVKIINEAYLKSNTPIQISLESQSLFNIQTKTMYGARFDYTFNKDFQVGGTFLHLGERPITQKVNYGDEPISNTIVGADATYRTDSRFLTNLLDRLPLYTTKEVSTITVSGEAAKLFPGHSKAVGAAGTSYIDDFEGAITPLDIKNPGQWTLASTPQKQTDIFPEDFDSIANGYNRAKFAWYYIDNLFQSRNSATPDEVTNDEMSNNYVRDVQEPEIFPNKSQKEGPRSIICTNMAFYPGERGPYNFDAAPTTVSAGINSDGTLKSPETRWGGVMRRIETTDFQNANIEFLQFWVMDPFNESEPGYNQDSPNDGTGGDFYIDLGDVSEDILRDSHKSYENGIYDPSGANPPLDGIWGKYPDPNLPQIGYNFDFDPTNRANQDVGLDGINDANERNFYSNYLNSVRAIVGAGTAADNAVQADPSNDDFHYFQGDTYNNASLPPLERYKKYNNMEGNSPTAETVDGYRALGSQYPDYEDLNRDFTLNNEEQYLQYHLDLRPNKMQIGQNYITDIVTGDIPRLPNGQTGKKVKWYQIKIPIRQPDKTVGAPNLTYINAIRLFMRGFRTPVILRFAKMEFLRGDWRKYDNSLIQPGEFDPIPEYPGNTSFDLSYVSIEENSSRQPVNYVLPPGIERERDISTSQLANLNEQSLTMKVCKLKDGDSRAAYKTTQLDVRTYKKLKMYIHAESSDDLHPLADKDMTAFVRIGSDFVDNYYEYEIPLYITQPGELNPDHIWPEQNNLEIDLDDLVAKKTERNNAMISDPSVTLLTPYPRYSGPATDKRITVKGSPNLSNVRVIMIGLRNPKDPANPNGVDLCGEVWVNELRLSGFDEKGGWAAIARVQAKLADLGNVSVVGSHSTAGWGSLEKRVNERDKEDKTSYDVTTSVELGKFIPEKAGIKIPVFFEYAEDFIKPQYTPLDPDVLYVNGVENAPKETKDSLVHSSQDYTRRKSLNFTNVKKTKTGKGGGKSHVYDIENLSATYAYTEIYHRNYDIEYSLTKTYQGILGYAYNNQPKPVEPFKKVKLLSSPYLKLVKDFNFNYAPSSLSLRVVLDRTYSELQLRNNTGLNFKIDPTFFKTYRMSRFYGLNWDLTKSLKFDFNADVLADIDEPPGRLDTRDEKDSVKTNLKNLGRMKNYHHVANVTYNLPLNKIPLIDWITASVRYSGDYRWTAGALALVDNTTDQYEVNSFQNTIQNAQTINYTGNVNFSSLYNKSQLIRKYILPKQPARPQNQVKAKPKQPIDSLNKAKKDSLNRKDPLEPVWRGLFSLLTSVKSAQATYSETNGTLVPGFIPKPEYLGTNFDFTNSQFPEAGSSNAPGWGFIFGSQQDLRPDAIRYHWITTDTTLNSQYITTNLQNFTGRIALEPVKNFKIDVSFNRNFSITKSEYFRANANGDFQSFSPTEQGSFSISYLTWNTSFIKDAQDYSNANFKNFSAYRPSVSQLLAEKNPASSGFNSEGYHNGYGSTQQEVLTYAFLAAYAGKTPDGKTTDRFPKIPKPNWRITYDGLSKLKFFQSFLQTLTLSHGYRSTYSINSFTQNLLYKENNEQPVQLDTVGNFIPKYDFQQISIAEQFSPLIGVELTFKNSLQARFEYKRDRTVSLSYASIQVTEVRGEEYTVGAGYKFKRVKLPFVRVGPAKTRVTNDLNLKADFNLRKNTTLIRKLVENANQPSSGSTSISVKVSLDYNVSERINLKLFADKLITNPFVSTSFPTSTLTAGLTIRFTLAQ